MDVITLALAKNYTNKRIAELASGFVYKGAVNYRADLDNIAAEIGHIYTVKYKGTSGTTPWNAEFVYGNYEGSNTWIELGPDYEADIAALKTGKQDLLVSGTNIKTINNISVLGSGNIDIQGGGAGYLLAEYNKTAFADVLAAYNAGKIIDVKANMTGIGDVSLHLKFVQLTNDTPTCFYFSQLLLDTSNMTVSVDAGGWHSNQIELERELVAGSAIGFDRDIGTARTIKVKYDDNTIKLNTDGKLYATTGTQVIANPTLVGTEANLDSIQIGDTKYNSSRVKPFPSEFVTKKTLQEFGQSIVNYGQFKMGSTWYGGIECTDLPGGMMQVECKVTAIRDTTITPYENIAIVEIFSSEVPPFYWTYNTNSWEKGTGLNDWKYVAEIDESKFDAAATINTAYDIKVKKVNSAASSTGWEFYPELSKPVTANPTLAGTEADLTGIQIGTTKYKVPAGGGEPAAYIKDAAVANEKLTLTKKDSSTVELDISGKQNKLTAGTNITIDADNKISADEQLPAYPTDTEGEYILALKYTDGAWVKYWKEIANKSDIVDKGTVDYMVIKQ